MLAMSSDSSEMTEAEWQVAYRWRYPTAARPFGLTGGQERTLEVFIARSKRSTVPPGAMPLNLEPVRDYDFGLVVDQAAVAAHYEVVRGRGGDIERDFHVAEIDWLEENAIRTAEEVAQFRILRDLVGNPFRPVTRTSPVRYPREVAGLAQAIYGDRTFDRLPALAAALDRAGYRDANVDAHCREPAAHIRGCWVLDLPLGKT